MGREISALTTEEKNFPEFPAVLVYVSPFPKFYTAVIYLTLRITDMNWTG